MLSGTLDESLAWIASCERPLKLSFHRPRSAALLHHSSLPTKQTRVNKDWRERNARDKHEMPRNYWSYPIVAGVQLCVRGTELVVESVASSSLEARMLGARAGDVLVAVVRAPSDASTALRVVSTGACARLCRRVRLVLAAALMCLCTPLLTAGVTCRTGKG
jgi:hypothetical protein